MNLPRDNRVAWCVIEGVAIFLDIAGDRYFRLPGESNDRFLGANLLPPSGTPVQPAGFPVPDSWLPPVRQCGEIDDGAFRLGDVARALWIQRRVERRLTRRPFGSVLRDLQCATERRAITSGPLTALPLRELRAFEQAKLLRSAADKCLPRSIALTLCLARRGFRAHVVLGVKLAPFAAHCWVQASDEVLNDEVEEVQRYTPILVV